jgi:hypothetical protein
LKRLAGTLVVLALLATAARADGGFSFRGYFKSFSILFVPPPAESGGGPAAAADMGAVTNRLRLMFTLRPSDRVAFDAAYDIEPRIQDPRLFNGGLFSPALTPPQYRVADFRNPLYPGPGETPGSFALTHNLDRFMLTVRTGIADIFLGRQAVTWGSARVINPTDILVPFAFNELDKEERTGVDALRVRVPLSAMDEIDAGFVAGDKLRGANDAFFLRGRTHQWETDIAGTVMGFRRHLLLGLDLARSVGGAGAWLEAAYVIPDVFRQGGRPAGEKDYFRASTGLEYNFSPKVDAFIEYHFNSAGAASPDEYTALAGTVPYRDGAVYLLGRHYLSVGSTYQLSALMPVTGLLIANLNDLSLMFSPSLEYNIAENIYLAGGAYIGLGRRPGNLLVAPQLTTLLFRSEFGAYPDMIYVSFRIYF